MCEAGRYAVRSAGKRRAQRGWSANRGAGVCDPVLLVPGFMAGDGTLRFMAGALRRQGFRTYRSHIHANVGCTLDVAAQLEGRLESIAQRRGGRVQIVGHSLGGMLARGLAVRRPDLVSGVVTLGSPMLAPGAHHASLARSVDVLVRLSRAGVPGLMSEDCVAGACARQSFDESRRPIPPSVAFTSDLLPARRHRGLARVCRPDGGLGRGEHLPHRHGHRPPRHRPRGGGAPGTGGGLSARSRSRRKCVASGAGAQR